MDNLSLRFSAEKGKTFIFSHKPLLEMHLEAENPTEADVERMLGLAEQFAIYIIGNQEEQEEDCDGDSE